MARSKKVEEKKAEEHRKFMEQVEKNFNRQKRKNFDPLKFRDSSSYEKYDTRLVRGSINLIEGRFLTKEDVDAMVGEMLKLEIE